MTALTEEQLKVKIIDSISNQGFYVNGHVSLLANDKAAYKAVQSFSRTEQIQAHSNFLSKASKTVSKYFISGNKINPSKIDLELREVAPNSLEETIYKWWNLMWWSVPYQRPYGRQMRFVLWDKYHNAPFGLIGLQSPVLKMAVRDNHLKLPKEDLDIWVNKSMQAQRLGALPPYNDLIGGKMVALALTSRELREAYLKKYRETVTILKERVLDPELLFITTTSAFGRSSIYNRLKYKKENVAISLGYTKGAGTFHITDGLYKEITDFLISKDIDVSTTFGNGPSKKLKLIGKAFTILKMPNYSYHNVKREYFLFPLADNLKQVIQENEAPNYYSRSFDDLSGFWKDRWCVPRSKNTDKWHQWDSDLLTSRLTELIDGQ